MFKFQITVHNNILIMKRLEDSRSKELRDETAGYFREELDNLIQDIFVEADGWDLKGSQIAIFKDNEDLKEYLEEFVKFINKNHAYCLYKGLLNGYADIDEIGDKITFNSIYGSFILTRADNLFLCKHTFKFSNILKKENDLVEISRHFSKIYPKEIFLNEYDTHIIRNKDFEYFRDTIRDLIKELPKIEINNNIINNIGEYISYWDYFDDLDGFLESKELYGQFLLDYSIARL